MAQELGVQFRYNVDIDGLDVAGGDIRGVRCGGQLVTADSYVVALGAYSTPLLRGIVDIPVYPLKGYSITVPIVEAGRAPASTILDETYKIAVTRFDDRIRVGGMAEISGFNNHLPEARRATLEHSVGGLFPGAGDLGRASYWSGLRPMTPDSVPVIGKTRLPNLFLNTGHGTLGWTMACGSGRLLADLVSGHTPEIDSSDLSLERYRHVPPEGKAAARKQAA